jgi:hypothetical protein
VRWRLSRDVELSNSRIGDADGRRQQRTAAEILRRFDRWPGCVLADEVGMGKTFVALAAAVSVIEGTDGERPVVVMVPSSVQEKWPQDWLVFREICLRGDSAIKATERTLRRGSEFLKLLDDPPHRRRHLIFLSHGAFTNSLQDPLVRMAMIRQALNRPSLRRQREAFPRWAHRVMPARRFWDRSLAEALLDTPPSRWRAACRRVTGSDPGDDPVPRPVLDALRGVDLEPLVETLHRLPLRTSSGVDERLNAIARSLSSSLPGLWKLCLRRLDVSMPLLILDEAHHVRNPWTRAAQLFANSRAEEETRVQGPLGNAFERMLFLTATPLQLGHHELVEVLKRFTGIRWSSSGLDRDAYEQHVKSLARELDATQGAALRFEQAWGALERQEFSEISDRWWLSENPDLSTRMRHASARYHDLATKMRSAKQLLRPLVIRHVKTDRNRREYRGRQILDRNDQVGAGLAIGGPALLPFLLGARTQALIAAEALRGGRAARAYFAEGIASSFEAYRDTRRRNAEAQEDRTGGDLLEEEPGDDVNKQLDWYLGELDRCLGESEGADPRALAEHPKIAATVRKAVDLWCAGEKTVVFCFFIATGRALRLHISQGIESAIADLAVEKLGLKVGPADARSELARLSDRFFDPDGRVTRIARGELATLFSVRDLPPQDVEQCTAIALRFLRTPAFLARYIDLSRDPVQSLRDALERVDASGRSLRDRLNGFAEFVESRVDSERAELLDALEEIATGEIRTGQTGSNGDPRPGEVSQIVPSVRLANGEVAKQTRRRLMLAFNTPFFPEVLVASSVMGEGIDLHLHCRHVIHHDLDWNPSVLEQRTGRLDRLGSHSELSGEPIEIFQPFVGGTQDEKCYRVVKDRERWFNVVMGENLELDEASTDQVANRVPLPQEIVEELRFKLGVRS